MKERPILFSGSMIRAILDGKKTQTRRVVKFKPQVDISSVVPCCTPDGKWSWVIADTDENCTNYFRCPYGVPGDRLWVRETFWHQPAGFQEACVIRYQDEDEVIFYRSEHNDESANNFKWRPAIFMPRFLSRITLEITDVRVQRLNEISEEDAIAEGVEKLGEFPDITPWRNYQLPSGSPHARNFSIARRSFISIWYSINAKRGHGSDKNEWVWAITFKRVQP